MSSEKKLIIQDIKIQNLRSYKDDTNKIIFTEHTNVIVGLNGSGKSSILEGLAYVLTGKVPEGINAHAWVNQTIKPPFKAGAELTLKDMQNDKTQRISKFMQASNKGDSGITVKTIREQDECDLNIKPAILKYCLICHEKQSQWMFETDTQVTKIFNEILNTEAYMNYSEVLGKCSNELQKVTSSGQSSGRGKKAVIQQANQSIITLENFIQAQRNMLEYKKIIQLIKNVDFKLVKQDIQNLLQMNQVAQNINFDIESAKEVIQRYNIQNNIEQTTEPNQQTSDHSDAQDDIILNQIKQIKLIIQQNSQQYQTSSQEIIPQLQNINTVLNKLNKHLSSMFYVNEIIQVAYPDANNLRTLIDSYQTQNQYIFNLFQNQKSIQYALHTEEQAKAELENDIQNDNLIIPKTLDNTINQLKQQQMKDLNAQFQQNSSQKQILIKHLNQSQHELDQLKQKQQEQEKSNEVINNINKSIDSLREQTNKETLNINNKQDQINIIEAQLSSLRQQLQTQKSEINKYQDTQNIIQQASERLNQLDKTDCVQLVKLLKCYIDNGTYNANNIQDSQHNMEEFYQSYKKIAFPTNDEKRNQLKKLLENPDAYKQILIERQADSDQQIMIKQYDKYLPDITQAYNKYLASQMAENDDGSFIKDNINTLVNIFNGFVNNLHQRSLDTLQDSDNDTQLYDFYMQNQYIFNEFRDHGTDIIEILERSIQTLSNVKVVYNQLNQHIMITKYAQLPLIITFIEGYQSLFSQITEEITQDKQKLNEEVVGLEQQHTELDAQYQQLMTDLKHSQSLKQQYDTQFSNLKQQLSSFYSNDNLEQQISSIQQQIDNSNGKLQVYEQNEQQLINKLQQIRNDIISNDDLTIINNSIKSYSFWKLNSIAMIYKNKEEVLKNDILSKQKELQKQKDDWDKVKAYESYYSNQLNQDKLKRQILEFMNKHQEYISYFKNTKEYSFLKDVNLSTINDYLNNLQDMFNFHSQAEYKNQQQRQYEDYKKNFENSKSEFVKRTINQLCQKELNLAKDTIQNAVKQFQTTSIINVNLMLKDMWQNVYRPSNNIGSVENIYISFSDNEKSNIVIKVRIKGQNGYEERTARNGLSSGQQVLFSILLRAALAKTFARNFTMLCLDEPTNFLDRQHAEDLAIYLKRFADENGTQLIVVTHSESFADALDRDGSVQRIVVEHGISGSYHSETLV